MSLVESLLGAIIRLDGDALVMHVGEKAYVVTTSASLDAFRGPLAWGQVELATKRLTLEAVSGMLQQLLPEHERAALAELGAIEYEIPPSATVPGRFTVIAARGGDDIWLEVRYHRPRPEVIFEAAPAAEAEAPAAEAVAAETPPEVESAPAEIGAFDPGAIPIAPLPAAVPASLDAELTLEAEPAEPEAVLLPIEPVTIVPMEDVALAPVAPAPIDETSEPVFELVDESSAIEMLPLEAPDLPEAPDLSEVVVDLGLAGPVAAAPEPTAPPAEPVAETAEAEDEVYDLSATFVTSGAELEAVALEEVAITPSAVVVPLARPTVRAEAPPAPVVQPSALDRLLRVAAARGASALYLVAQARPVLRVDGEMTELDGEDPLSAAGVSAMLMELAPEPTREALASGEVSEWMCDVPGLGRIRAMSFRDHRGPGGIFRMLPARALSAEQLGLSPAIQALSAEPEGLVLVTGPRASGKSTLVSAFVDLVNRTRADHVITLESQIVFVHETRRSFVSQRELRGTGDALVAAARAALREDPDVLVIEDLHAPELVSLALEAAESGRLVLGALPAAGATAALEKVIDQFPPERRTQVQAAIAGALRAVVAQVLVRKIGGGRVAARELLLNSRAVAALIAEGKTFQLPHAMDSGRKQGMAPLNDALVSLVRAASIDPAEAYRRTYDREGLLAQLRREGVDTSFVERLA